MEIREAFKEIEHKRELWDQMSYFNMWGVRCVTLRDLDELEQFLSGKTKEPGINVELLLINGGIKTC